MVQTIIFDLSEVLIAGIVGVEKPLAERLGVPKSEVWSALQGNSFIDLLCGRITEDDYLRKIIKQQGWNITIREMKSVIRQNFHRKVPGMDEILARLLCKYELILLSDHVTEWVEYIRSIHRFLRIFRIQLFSFDPRLMQVKNQPSTFSRVLKIINRSRLQCHVVDDFHDNIKSCNLVGIPGTWFKSAEQLLQEFSRIGILT